MSAGAVAHVEAIRRFVELVNAGRHEEALAWLLEDSHPDLEFRTAVGGAIDGRVQRGPVEARRYFDDLFDTFDKVRYDEPEFTTRGDQLLMLTRLVGHGRESGVVVDLDIGLVCEFEDGLIRRATTYRSHADALAAAEALDA